MCQNRPKWADFWTKNSDIYFFICDIYFFIWAFLQLFYNLSQKKKISQKKKKISRQISIFFWPKWPLQCSHKKGQKQRNRVSRFLGPAGNMKKSEKCNDNPSENWVKWTLSKNAYYSRLCSITGMIWHFCEKTPISISHHKKEIISRWKICPNVIFDFPYYITKN